MQPYIGYIVEPLDGRRYNDLIELGDGVKLFISASIEDAKSTTRIARILSKQKGLDQGLEVGDYAIVHHNTFRQFYDQQGKLSYGLNFIGDGKYLLDPNMIYMMSKDCETWIPCEPYIFVEPIKQEEGYETFEREYGLIRYSSHPDYKVGERIKFTIDSEYEFRFGTEVLYRMKHTDVLWKE